jgi:hypothetical protein
MIDGGGRIEERAEDRPVYWGVACVFRTSTRPM